MKIIEHRVNKPIVDIKTPYAEIDIHINKHGDVVVRHEPIDEDYYSLDEYLCISKHEKFFVDIKQNLDVDYLKKIIEEFGDRLLGLFDLPLPSAYYAAEAGIEFYGRLSEFEPVSHLTNKYWVDPLRTQYLLDYLNLLEDLDGDCCAIICCPSLHGHNLGFCKPFWHWLKFENKWDIIEGIVTKYPNEFGRPHYE
jgi:hypothetical protein